MSEFREGDLVEAVKGDTVIRGWVKDQEIAGASWSLKGLEAQGFSVTVVERAMPTENGVYVARYDSNGDTSDVFLRKRGRWLTLPNIDGYEVVEGLNFGIPKPETLIRLEPVPVTLAKVRDALTTALPNSMWAVFDAALSRVERVEKEQWG